MSKSPFSLLLLRRVALTSHNKTAHLCPLHHLPCGKPFSTSSPDPPKPSSLSARLSFVFDQIDAIEREHTEKDQTLQRIRAWRQFKDAPKPIPEVATQSNNDDDRGVEPGSSAEEEGMVKEKGKEVVHPWPEWIELMERLVKQNYFDHRRKDEDKMVRDLGLDLGSDGIATEEGVDFIKDIKAVQNACLYFGKDRFDILRPLSRKDIQIMVGYGCPSSDKKVVFSSKLLRKHAHLDEGDVCSNCSLRSSCERAYLLTNKEDEARTIDVMRVLLAYGLDHVHGTITNKPLLKQKSVKIVVRKLLHEIVKLSAIPIDPNLPPPIVKRPPPKVKQPPPPPKKRVGRDDIEMKKGDWLCPKCDFMNFSKNTVCLQCDAKRPKRQLLPGEWECPECNFLNYRRNLVCFHCECKRPPDEFMEAKMEERQNSARIQPEKTSRRPEVPNAWNFDFDDDESDGADVAAFEYADFGAKSPRYPADGQAEGRNFRGRDAVIGLASRGHRMHEQEHSAPDHIRSGMGFDDFDDEDDVDSYEVDTRSCSPSRKGSQNEFDERGISDLEQSDSGDDMSSPPRSSSQSYNNLSRKNQKTNLSGSGFGDGDTYSDEELSGNPEWRSSHIADTKYKASSRGPKGPPRKPSFGSDEEMDLDSDEDLDNNFCSTKGKGNNQMFQQRNFRSSDQEDVSFSGSDSDDDRHFRTRRAQMESGRRDNNFINRGCGDATRNSGVRSKGKMGRSSWDDEFDGSPHHSMSREYDRGGPRMDSRSRNLSNSREARGQDFQNRQRETPSRHAGRGFGGFGNSDESSSWDDDLNRPPRSTSRGGSNNAGQRMTDKLGNSRDFRGGRQGSGRGRPSEYGRDMDSGFGEFKNSRRVIER